MNSKLQNTYQIVKVIWQIVCNSSNKNNTHNEKACIYISKVNFYKFVPWLKKFDKKYTVHHLPVCDQEF